MGTDKGEHPILFFLRQKGSLPALALLCASILLPAGAGAQELRIQLKELEQLIDNRDYRAALQDLKFIADQIQELRLEKAAHLFPSAPEGWTSSPPLRTSLEEDFWSRRLEIQQTYTEDGRAGTVRIVLDFFSPLIPSVSLNLNPLYIASNPNAELLDLSGHRARLVYNPSRGEGEITLIIGASKMISIIGRGLDSRSSLSDFARRLNYSAILSHDP